MADNKFYSIDDAMNYLKGLKDSAVEGGQEALESVSSAAGKATGEIAKAVGADSITAQKIQNGMTYKKTVSPTQQKSKPAEDRFGLSIDLKKKGIEANDVLEDVNEVVDVAKSLGVSDRAIQKAIEMDKNNILLNPAIANNSNARDLRITMLRHSIWFTNALEKQQDNPYRDYTSQEMFEGKKQKKK